MTILAMITLQVNITYFSKTFIPRIKALKKGVGANRWWYISGEVAFIISGPIVQNL